MADRITLINNKLNHNHKKKKNKSKKKKGSSSKSAAKKLQKKLSLKKVRHPTDVNLIRTVTDNLDSFSEPNTSHNVPENDYQHFDDRTYEITSNERNKYKWVSGNSGANQVSQGEPENNYVRNDVFEKQNTYHTDYFHNNASYIKFHSSEENNSRFQRIDYLKQENHELNDTLFQSKCNWNDTNESKIDLIFKNDDLKEKFHDVLRGLISSLLNGSITAEELKEFCSSTENKNREKASEPDCLFSVDCASDPHKNENTPVPIPRYNTSFHEILETPDESKASSPVKKNRVAQDCFNCGENHHLNNCPRKLDHQKIAIARRGRKRNFFSSLRYHVHGKNETDFKPGAISNELKEALHLQENQIPLYIYRMRLLDYPPGWLNEAVVESSGITLYDSDGNAQNEENCENGDVDTSMMREVQYDPDKLVEYPGFNVPLPPDIIDESHEKNLPELQQHQLKCFIIQNMVKPDTCPSRKRKLKLPDNKLSNKSQRCEEDMEIEVIESDNSNEFVSEFVPPLPDAPPSPEYIPPPPPPDYAASPSYSAPDYTASPSYSAPDDIPPLPSGGDESEYTVISQFGPDSPQESVLSATDRLKIKSCSDFDSGTSSPSLAELVELKKKLVRELGINLEDVPSSSGSVNEDSCPVVDLTGDKNSEGDYIIEDEFIASEHSNELSNISDTSNSEIDRTNDSAESPVSMHRTGSKSKLVSLGTPSLSRHSSFSKLPDYDKFSENVSPHIPFENLPSSTGTYSKMKNVLKKVKDKLNSLMQ